MNQTTSSIAVVICAFTEARWQPLCSCIESLRAQTLPASELILVIDHNPRLYERAKAAFADVTVLKNSDARGLSGARNTGIRHSSAEIIAFIDDDAQADRHWTLALGSAFGDESVMAVGGRIDPQWESGQPRWMPAEFYWVVGCTYRGMPDHVSEIRNVIGANMAFRRDVFESVGLFRNDVGRQGEKPFGCEETELSIRARQYAPDRSIVFAPDAVVRHLIPASRTQLAYFTRRCYAEGRSKAQVSSLVGSDDALATERTYTRVTLPHGVRRGLADAMRGDLTGLARSTAIAGGLAFTCAGYLRGQLSVLSSGAIAERAPGFAVD
jgi:GT2 family glycosyltransferase